MAAADVVTSRAIVCAREAPGEAVGSNWVIENVKVRALKDGELRVRLVSTGVCHTDLVIGGMPNGAMGCTFPKVLGHEGAGYIDAIGPNCRSHHSVGDPVLLSFAYCQNCRQCNSRHPGYCPQMGLMNFPGDADTFATKNGDAQGQFFGQSSFSNYTIAKDVSTLNVKDIVKDEKELAMFAPLGCGFQTGAGTVASLGQAGPDDFVVIMGLGGVGLTAVMSAAIHKCRAIIAIDRVQKRLDFAKSLGATHTIDTTGIKPDDLEAKVGDQVREITSGNGATLVIDTTGFPALIHAGFAFSGQRGRVVILGIPPPDSKMSFDLNEFLMSGKQVTSSIEGDVIPSEFIPQMIKWYREGKFPIDKLIKTYKFEDFQTALHDMETGETIKPILLY